MEISGLGGGMGRQRHRVKEVVGIPHPPLPVRGVLLPKCGVGQKRELILSIPIQGGKESLEEGGWFALKTLHPRVFETLEGELGNVRSWSS